MRSKEIIIIGNGGHASVLTEILLAQGEKILGFTAPTVENNQFSLEYLGNDEVILNYSTTDIELVLGVGMVGPASLRKNIFHCFNIQGYVFKNIIHPSAMIAPSVIFGQGVQIMAGAIIQTNTKVADNTIINTGAVIDHDCHIEQDVHIAPGAKLSGNVHVRQGSHIGTGATIIQGIEIGTNCLIGAGSVVVKSINSGVTALGVPAKEV
ncbi:acetyltransferase [Metasolibacillus sp.]|uniref:acetyltransferase n=1 Tax=Metasolibacillus sp. TaxID=2703680 RepID=UPI0025DCF964|nr:acetyltransferase [Metasolibacillus sp.]MCT6925668.1 acetyltransferase [Metasolibacillus sp.]MCT6940988.1 acetyltransferase [Metasolibacillus sp.]